MNKLTGGAKRKATEIKKYGSEEAYRAEMRRRRGMVLNPGTSLKGDSGKARELANKRWKNNASQEIQGS